MSRIYGYPGDGINGVVGALARVKDDIDFVQARHEEMAAFMAAHSESLASTGAAMPYAIAAKFAHPSRTCIAMVGDGAMQMNGLNELITVAKYWRRWSNPRLAVLVLNNRDLNMVSWEQRVVEGDPKYPASQELPDVSYTAFAQQLG